MANLISREALKARLDSRDPPRLVEALPLKYFEHAHLPGALHLPHDEVEGKASTVLPDKAADIVVYCAHADCANSHIAAEALERLGYSRVSIYAGGKKDWIEAGLPVESRREAA